MISKAISFLLLFFASSIHIIGLCQDIRIDHIISVVTDLDSATYEFESLGFTVKSGRLHNNNLFNAHIKFSNRTSLEIMSVAGAPKDKIARDYAVLLTQGEGGVYLALTGTEPIELQRRLNKLSITFNVLPGKNWDYITFPKNSSLAHIFFISYHIKIEDSNEVLVHKNKTESIKAVWIEGNDSVIQLLEGLGLPRAEYTMNNKLEDEICYQTGTGKIIIIPYENPKLRPRIKAVSFTKKDKSEGLIIDY